MASTMAGAGTACGFSLVALALWAMQQGWEGGEGALLELIQPGRDQAPALFDPLGLKGKAAVTGMCPPLI